MGQKEEKEIERGRERERQRQRQTDRQTDRQRQREEEEDKKEREMKILKAVGPVSCFQCSLSLDQLTWTWRSRATSVCSGTQPLGNHWATAGQPLGNNCAIASQSIAIH